MPSVCLNFYSWINRFHIIYWTGINILIHCVVVTHFSFIIKCYCWNTFDLCHYIVFIPLDLGDLNKTPWKESKALTMEGKKELKKIRKLKLIFEWNLSVSLYSCVCIFSSLTLIKVGFVIYCSTSLARGLLLYSVPNRLPTWGIMRMILNRFLWPWCKFGSVVYLFVDPSCPVSDWCIYILLGSYILFSLTARLTVCSESYLNFGNGEKEHVDFW